PPPSGGRREPRRGRGHREAPPAYPRDDAPRPARDARRHEGRRPRRRGSGVARVRPPEPRPRAGPLRPVDDRVRRPVARSPHTSARRPPRGPPQEAAGRARRREGAARRARRVARRRGRAGGCSGARDRGRSRGTGDARVNGTELDRGVGEILIDADALRARVGELGAEISEAYGSRDLLLIGVLKGAVFFMADLMRHLRVPCEIDFMAISSYGASTDSSGVVRILKDLDINIEGRHVLVVEDIIDSGLTLSYLIRNLE